jgi:hypothetical protein
LFWTGPDGTGMSWANASACVVAGILVPAYRAGGRWDVGRCTSFLGTDLLWRVLCAVLYCAVWRHVFFLLTKWVENMVT